MHKGHPVAGWPWLDLCRRSPNLRLGCPCSIISPARLNFRVRAGSGSGAAFEIVDPVLVKLDDSGEGIDGLRHAAEYLLDALKSLLHPLEPRKSGSILRRHQLNGLSEGLMAFREFLQPLINCHLSSVARPLAALELIFSVFPIYVTKHKGHPATGWPFVVY
jgi:hypothetical protein